VVGGGMVGLTTAHYLSYKHPNNKVIVIERSNQPYTGTSK